MRDEPEQPIDEEETRNAEIVRLPRSVETEIAQFRDPEALARLLDQPLITIAETVTGALSLGRSDAILIGGRLVQAALKGKLLTQVGREINQLIEKGKIREDYAKTKFGFKSLVELLEFIDSEVPDEDRLRAVKAMFIAINAVDAKEGEEIVNYQLLQISKGLSASQLFVLKTVYDLHKENAFVSSPMLLTAREWLGTVAQRIGHNLTALVEQDEILLIKAGLITERSYQDRSGVNRTNARLSDLGIRFCDYLIKYGGQLPA